MSVHQMSYLFVGHTFYIILHSLDQTFWLSCSLLYICDSAVFVVTDSRPDVWCFIPERQDLSFTSTFRLALDIGKTLCKRKEKTVLIHVCVCVCARACCKTYWTI
jgi:hypothetical protein